MIFFNEIKTISLIYNVFFPSFHETHTIKLKKKYVDNLNRDKECPSINLG